MRTERGFDRLVNFSDAVVAIAITLLILPLVDSAGELTSMDFGELIEKDGPGLLVFLISFAVIGRFWLAHHAMYENVIGYSRSLLLVNLLWLITIVFLPFPTELIANNGHDNPATSSLYIGTMLGTSLTGLWQQWIIVRNPELQAEAVRGTLRMGPSAVMTGMMTLVFVLVVLFPAGGLFWLFVLLLIGPAGIVYRRRYRKAHPGEAVPE